MTDLNKEQKEILDNLPQKQLKRMSNMSRVNRARKVYNMLPAKAQAQMIQANGDPKRVMEIINAQDEDLKVKIKEVAGDLLDWV